jgi:hypothetical protein
MQRRRTPRRASALVAVVAAALLPPGCGNGTEQRAAPRPLLPRAVAVRLAQTSDGVAAALAGGDNCRALTLARSLRRQTNAVVDAARVPAALRRPLQAAANDLAGRIDCTPPPPAVVTSPPEAGKGHGKGKHKGQKKHGKGHD